MPQAGTMPMVGLTQQALAAQMALLPGMPGAPASVSAGMPGLAALPLGGAPGATPGAAAVWPGLQLPQAPNRTKWGCYHLGESLELLEAAERVRRRFPGIKLAGPAVIDFEPAPLLRLLYNRRRFTLDVATALLYVDRRGAPANTQSGILDLARKVRFTAAACRASPRVARGAPLWITELNWPLLGTDYWTPTSDEECVDEATAADFLTRSYGLAWATGQVERVYWWQLTAPGYGLVDARNGLRVRPAYHALRKLLR